MVRRMRPADAKRQAARTCELAWMPAQELVAPSRVAVPQWDRPGGVSTEELFRFSELKSWAGRNAVVSINSDHQAQAEAAIRCAALATSEHERLEWVRIALAWKDLDRDDEDPAISIAPLHSLSFAGN